MSKQPAQPPRETFPAPETATRLRHLLQDGPLIPCPSDKAFVRRGPEGEESLRFEPPLIQPIRPGETPSDFLARLAGPPRRQVVLLVQAGASALGLWHGEHLVAHKVIKKYVVRGKGRAQPTHLKTRGKSRQGSRLRLRNALSQLVQTNEKLAQWREEHGAFDDVFYSCPKRTWPELFAVDPAPPFDRDAAIRIPLDVHVPDFEELLRVRRKTARGAISRGGAGVGDGDS